MMKTRLLLSCAAALGASCGLTGDDCDSEGNISSASQLGDLDLDGVTNAPIIDIKENSSLTSISMAALTRISSRLHVQDNESLSALTFPVLAAAGVLRFIQNSVLPDCLIYGLVDQVAEREGSTPGLEIRLNLEDECTPK